MIHLADNNTYSDLVQAVLNKHWRLGDFDCDRGLQQYILIGRGVVDSTNVRL